MSKEAFILREVEGIVVIKKDDRPKPKPDKVMDTIEEALLQAPIEWIE
jgi:predicted membrane GTPase involved in stress response